MHDGRNLRDFYHAIKERTTNQNMLLKDISHILHSARHVKVTQLGARSSSTRVQECFSAPENKRRLLAALTP